MMGPWWKEEKTSGVSGVILSTSSLQVRPEKFHRPHMAPGPQVAQGWSGTVASRSIVSDLLRKLLWTKLLAELGRSPQQARQPISLA